MFPRFSPLASICASLHDRAVQDRQRTRRGRRPPDRRATNGARFRLEGLEERCLLSGISGYTEYPIPSGNTGTYITTGPDGNLWFTEGNASKVGMISPTTHAVTEFATPTASSNPREITAGPDGNIWFTEFTANKLGMINPTTHAITEFAIPTGYQPWGITAGPDGNIWFAQVGGGGGATGAIGMFNLTTHAFSSFAPSTFNAGPWGITAGPDGNLWFTEHGGSKIGEINPTTHIINEYSIPATGGPIPEEIAAGSDGNLWFTVPYTYTGTGVWVGMINPSTDVISLLATTHAPSGITSGPDGNIWFGDGQLGRINPTSDAITQFPVTASRGITTGPDGNLWLASGSNIIVATLSPTETDLVVTQQPPANVTAGSPFGLTVQAVDGSGNLLSSFNGTVTVALANNPGGATVGGTLTATASNGVATFAGLTLDKAASGYTLVASSGVSGLGFTSAITVTPAAATHLVITQQPPATVKVNAGFGMQASIEDAYGNVVTTATNTVSVAFANNPTGATLGGTRSVTASQGVASFSGLTINKTGAGYTLQVSSNGLSSAVTSATNVTKNGGSSALAAPGGGSTPDPFLAPLVLDSPDLWDSLGLKKRVRSI